MLERFETEDAERTIGKIEDIVGLQDHNLDRLKNNPRYKRRGGDLRILIDCDKDKEVLSATLLVPFRTQNGFEGHYLDNDYPVNRIPRPGRRPEESRLADGSS